MKKLLLFLIAALFAATSSWAQTSYVNALGSSGWYSDDTRSTTGADLVGVNSTYYGKPGQIPTYADDIAIAGQLQFVDGPAGGLYGGAVKIISPTNNAAKSTISTVNLGGFASTSNLVSGLFSATYKWYMEPNSTQRTLAFRIGVQSTQWLSSQSGFTAIRSGESTWDLILVNIMNSPVANDWNDVTVDLNNGLWYLYDQAGNPYFTPPAGTLQQTLSQWNADPIWGPILFGTGSIITNVQFGLGSGQQGCNAYVDYLQTTILNGGNVIDFVTPPEPITTIVPVTTTTCGNYDFQLSVQDFINVGAISLLLNYDVAKLDYINFTQNLAFSNGIVLNEYIPGQLSVSYFSSTGVTLADNDVFLTLNFNLLPSASGILSNFTWSTAPAQNEYAGPAGVPVYTSTFNDLSWTIPVRPVKNVDTGLEYCKIQDAIDATQTLNGHTITVASGTYKEQIVVNKLLDIRGPNYGIDGNSGSRVAEAIIVPPSELNLTASPREWSTVPLVKLSVNGVKLDGFKISGDNTDINGYSYAGMNVEAGLGIESEADNVVFQNNVVEKFTYMGFNAKSAYGDPRHYDIIVAHNKFSDIHDMNQLGYGFAIYMQGTTGTVNSNTVLNSRTGIQVQPYTVIQSGTTAPDVSNNNFSVWRNAIYYNYAELNASAWTITLNNITACAPPVNPTGRVCWQGISVETMRATSNGGTISFNTINGTGASIDANNWWGVWGMLYKGTSSLSTNVFFTSNIVSNVDLGLVHSASADIVVTGNSLSASGQAICIQHNYSSAGVDLGDGGINNINATGGNTINGVASIGATNAQLFVIEDAIMHKIDENWRGFVLVKANNAYVTDIATATAINNDYTRIRNAVDYVSNNWTINLHGTFDWTETNAAASWALGNDGVVSPADDYGIYARTNLNGVTFTAPEGLGYAIIQGPGDLPNANLEGVLAFDGGDNKNWTISNIEFLEFDMPIYMGNGAGGTDAFEGTLITNNKFNIAKDLNKTVAPADPNQNIGLHFSFGVNQTISNNTFNVPGDGVSDGTNYSTIVVMQSNTSGGAVYDGLKIKNNIINVIGVPDPVSPSVIRGIWENSANSDAAIEISGNIFTNANPANTADLNRQVAFWITSVSSATKKVEYKNNEVSGFSEGAAWIGGLYTSYTPPNYLTGQYPVEIKNNKFDKMKNSVVVRKGLASTNPGSPAFIQNNSFTNTVTGGYAIKNEGTGTTESPCNWYGTNTVTGVVALVSSLVNYTPWLVDGTDDPSGGVGFQPLGTCTGAENLYVNDLVSDNPTNDIYTTAIGNDGNAGTAAAPFLTISKAVNTAVDGTKIWVDAGTFQEQVQINKTLEITGVDYNKTIILAPVTMALTGYWYASPPSNPIVYAYGPDKTVNVRKLCINGDGGRNLDHFIGMEYYEANGTFDLCKITGIRDVGIFTGMQRGHAFYGFYTSTTGTHTLNITNNLILDYQKGGIYVDGSGANTDVLIHNNAVTGQGVANVTAQNGISPAWCDVIITDNLVTNNIWNKVEHPHEWMASGIMLYETETSNVYGNTLNGNEVGLWGYNTVTPTYGINTFNNNKVHVYEDVTAHDPDFVYDKRVDNPSQPEAVFGCIQYAVDEAASGATLDASAGTFVENVVVHTPVTVNGAGMTSTIVMPSFVGANTGGGSLAPGSSNIFLVQANNVTIQNLTVDGNNPLLTSGVLSNGVDVDARNGIITNHSVGVYNDLNVNNVKLQNIYLRGIYASTGGTFNFSTNTITNVAGESQSIAMMNWGGSGVFTGNTVSNSNDGIVSNWSNGSTYSFNNVTNCGSGIHTDNNGGFGGTPTADLIFGNNVSAGPDGSYGIFVFASYMNNMVYENTISGVDIGLCASGQQGGSPLFTRNTVTGNEIGVYTTTNLFGWGSSNCNATFTNNFINNNTVKGFEIESEAGYTNNTTANENQIVGNLLGVNVNAGGTTNAIMTCDWWGTADGDLIAPMITGTVNYIQWLVSGIDNDLVTPGFQPTPGSCGGAPDFTGNYKYYNSGLTALTNINVELWKGGVKLYGPVATDGSGNYTLTNVLPDTYEVRANTAKAVGGINSTDAAQVNFWGVTPSSIEKVRWLSGDVAGTDFKVNANDALLIQNYFLTQGNPSTPFNSTWSFWSVGELIGSNPGVSFGYPQVVIPAVGTTVSKNFYGLVTGDFNRSFTPSALKSGSESLTLNYGQTIETGAEAFELPLYADLDMTVGAVSLILNIPSDMLQVNNVYLGSDANTPVLYDVTGDELRISWFSSESLQLQAGQRLVTLVLQVVEPTAEPIYLSLATDPLNELADQNFEVFNAQLTVDIIKTTALGMGENLMQNNILFSNYPNPFVGTTSFVYTIPTDGKVLIEVYDIVGNRVMEAVNETQSAGEYLLKLDRNNLRPGVYTATLKLENNGSVISRTIKVISK